VDNDLITDHKNIENTEAQIQLFMEIVNDLVIILNPQNNYRIELVNKSPLLHKLGYSYKGLIGKNFSSIIQKDDTKKISKILRKDAESGEYVQEIKLKTIKGEVNWAEINSKRFKTDINEEKILIILKDISQRKRLEEELKENEERFKKITETIPEIRFWKLFNPKKYEEALQNSYEMLQKVMENIPQYIFWKSNDLNYLGCNNNYAKLIGSEHPENIINKNDSELLWDELQIDNNIKQETEVIESKLPQLNLTEHWILKDGDKIWVQISRIPLYDSDSNVVGILGTFEDVTERKKAEEILKESEKKYRYLIESSPYAIVLFNSAGEVIDYNSTTEKLFGYEKGVFIGKSYEDLPLYPPGIFSILNKKLRALYKGGDVEPTEFQVYKKDRTFIWVNTRLSLIELSGIKYFQAIVEDITDKKEAEKKLKESEEKYRDLLETSSVGILEINFSTKNVTYINPKFLELAGYNERRLLEDHFLEKIIHPDDINKVLKAVDERDLEFRILTKSGKLKWLHAKKSNQYDEDGHLVNFRLWLEDVTEQKMYEELIYELNINFLNFTTDIQKNIELLLNTCLKLLHGEIVLYVNKIMDDDEEEQYRIITNKGDISTYDSTSFQEKFFINEVFNENHDFPQIFYDVDETKYDKIDEFLLNNNIKACYGKLIMSGNELNDALCVLYRNNSIISNQDKLVLFLMCDALEIEQRRWQAQLHLEEQNKTLSEINKLKTDLFSRTSHELKTPLISIKGFTELLLNLYSNKLDSDVISILEEIKDGSKRLEKFINSIVESSKAEQGLLKANKTEENLSFLIRFCVKQLQGAAKLRNQNLVVKIHDDLVAKFDKEKIYEVISNLLINSIKYTPLGGQITIGSQIKDDSYIISVKDNGIGLTEEDKKQLFTQFGKIERYGQGWDVGIEGTGLGLYISKEIIDLHDGKIWAESEGKNKGSTFYFLLPVNT